MPTLIFVLFVSFASAFAANTHETRETKKPARTEAPAPAPEREPASAEIAEVLDNASAEKLLGALEEVDEELRLIQGAPATVPNDP